MMNVDQDIQVKVMLLMHVVIITQHQTGMQTTYTVSQQIVRGLAQRVERENPVRVGYGAHGNG